MNPEIDFIFNNKSVAGEHTALSHYYIRFCAKLSVAGCSTMYGWADKCPIGEVPAYLLADSATYQEMIESEWAAPFIAQAREDLDAQIAKFQASIGGVA